MVTSSLTKGKHSHKTVLMTGGIYIFFGSVHLFETWMDVERCHGTKVHDGNSDFVIMWCVSKTTKPQGHRKDFCHSF